MQGPAPLATQLREMRDQSQLMMLQQSLEKPADFEVSQTKNCFAGFVLTKSNGQQSADESAKAMSVESIKGDHLNSDPDTSKAWQLLLMQSRLASQLTPVST